MDVFNSLFIYFPCGFINKKEEQYQIYSCFIIVERIVEGDKLISYYNLKNTVWSQT